MITIAIFAPRPRLTICGPDTGRRGFRAAIACRIGRIPWSVKSQAKIASSTAASAPPTAMWRPSVSDPAYTPVITATTADTTSAATPTVSERPIG